jgi:hypothetical protein
VTEPVVRRIPEASDIPHPLGRAGVNHDPRSRAFAFAPPEPLPLRDVAWKRRVPIYDQGNLGSCTANALCGALSTLPQKHHFRSQRNIVKVYSEATRIDPWPGAWEPDDTGSDGLSVAKVALRRGWINRYEHVFSFTDFMQAMMRCSPIVGTVWKSSMFRTEADGRLRVTGSDVGGHEYQPYGVDVTERRIWCYNSWSESWGAKGRFYLSWDDFADLLADDGDCTVLLD